MTQNDLQKILKFLKNRSENEKSKGLYDELMKDKLIFKDKKTGQEKSIDFTLDLKYDFIRRNIQPGIIKKIFKGEIE